MRLNLTNVLAHSSNINNLQPRLVNQHVVTTVQDAFGFNYSTIELNGGLADDDAKTLTQANCSVTQIAALKNANVGPQLGTWGETTVYAQNNGSNAGTVACLKGALQARSSADTAVTNNTFK